MAQEELVIHGAREHNLKDIDVRLPRNKLICITGLSGSGKSSLAFDTMSRASRLTPASSSR
jgi:excinuclease ABC subunit A